MCIRDSGLSRNFLKGADIDCLAVISQPIAKVSSLHHHRGPFVVGEKGDGLEQILYISMSPIFAFYTCNRGNVSGAKRINSCRQHDERHEQDNEQILVVAS